MNVTAVAIIAIIAGTIISIVESGKKKSSKADKLENEQLRRDVAQLQERIEVLERIVTDSSYDLKKQFKDLEKDKVA